MPTILRIGRFRFFFFSNEGNEPPHIHVKAGDSIAKFWLNPVELAANHGFNGKTLRRLEVMVEAHREFFQEAWNEYFRK
jgi:hypothetical protein